jgi:hypothetical protein
VSEPSSSPAKRRGRARVLPAILAGALLIPNIFVIALGIEDFPFTTAPMFAHYVGPETELYVFRFEGVADETAEPLPIAEIGREERALMRQFTNWYYRPLTPTSPLRDIAPDSGTPEEFTTRMTEFFGPIADFLRERRAIEYDSIELHVDITDSEGRVIDSRHVGTYDAVARTYTQLDEATR